MEDFFSSLRVEMLDIDSIYFFSSLMNENGFYEDSLKLKLNCMISLAKIELKSEDGSITTETVRRRAIDFIWSDNSKYSKLLNKLLLLSYKKPETEVLNIMAECFEFLAGNSTKLEVLTDKTHMNVLKESASYLTLCGIKIDNDIINAIDGLASASPLLLQFARTSEVRTTEEINNVPIFKLD